MDTERVNLLKRVNLLRKKVLKGEEEEKRLKPRLGEGDPKLQSYRDELAFLGYPWRHPGGERVRDTDPPTESATTPDVGLLSGKPEQGPAAAPEPAAVPRAALQPAAAPEPAAVPRAALQPAAAPEPAAVPRAALQPESRRKSKRHKRRKSTKRKSKRRRKYTKRRKSKTRRRRR
jgi:hypothetical protein